MRRSSSRRERGGEWRNGATKKAGGNFNFRQTGKQLSGDSITLYKVDNGKLQTEEIDAEEF